MMVGTKLAHQAFLYDGAEQFAEAMAPVVRAGVERGDKVLVAAKRASTDARREWARHESTRSWSWRRTRSSPTP